MFKTADAAVIAARQQHDAGKPSQNPVD